MHGIYTEESQWRQLDWREERRQTEVETEPIERNHEFPYVSLIYGII